MFRLTREVRFSINDRPDDQLNGPPANSHGGYPSLSGFGRYLAAQVTLAGELEPASQYLVNIKRIDDAVREVIPEVEKAIRPQVVVNRMESGERSAGPLAVAGLLFDHVRERWPEQLESLSLALSPFLTLWFFASEYPMTRLSQKFEFSASHRLHNSELSEEENRRTFGKCNNPMGHGHNYEVQVTLIGDGGGEMLVNVPAFERIVAETVIDRFDHRHLNHEVAEFQSVNPTVENIAKVIYRLLAPKVKNGSTKLAAVTVWETPKTWCEYSE
jgi:6-pyruvoyltetrahydropterin/6-carboxytetrahydropterin synthase